MMQTSVESTSSASGISTSESNVWNVAKKLLGLVAATGLGISLYGSFTRFGADALLIVIPYVLIAPLIVNPWIVGLSFWLPMIQILGVVPTAVILAIFGRPTLLLLWGYRNSTRYQLGLGPRPEGEPVRFRDSDSDQRLVMTPVTAIKCYSCKTELPVTSENRGTKVRCPKCHMKQHTPG